MNVAYVLAAVALLMSCAALFLAAADALADAEPGDIIPVEVPAGRRLSDFLMWVELPERKR